MTRNVVSQWRRAVRSGLNILTFRRFNWRDVTRTWKERDSQHGVQVTKILVLPDVFDCFFFTLLFIVNVLPP